VWGFAYARLCSEIGTARGAKGCQWHTPSINQLDHRDLTDKGEKRWVCVLPLGRFFHFFKTLFGVFQIFFQVCDVIFKRLGFLTPAWPPPRRPPEAAGERPKRMSPRSIFIIPKVPSRVHGHPPFPRFAIPKGTNGILALIPSKSAHAPNFVNRFDAPHDAALSQASFAWANPLKTHAALSS
jgi:hypothetical protein